MQEEIENKVCNLAISTTKLAARDVVNTVKDLLKVIKGKDISKIDGKQTVKELIGQDQGVTNIDISKTDLKGLEKYARKYGIDYAITKENGTKPAKYHVFFKARDSDAMDAAFNEYSAELLKKREKPSILNELKKMKEKVMAVPVKAVVKDKEIGR